MIKIILLGAGNVGHHLSKAFNKSQQIDLVQGNEENRIIRAYKNAKIYKSDLSGKADSIHFNRKNGVAQLININDQLTNPFVKTKKPILWNLENQITGDSIHLLFNKDNDQLDSLLVFNNA